jgi:hypothetical protein
MSDEVSNCHPELLLYKNIKSVVTHPRQAAQVSNQK